MKRALEMLGYDPCYHMYELRPYPERIQMSREIAFGHIDPDWDAVFGGYHATVDWPAATYWRELAVRYPDAKILLTRRDSESWYRSMEKTILQVIARKEDGASVSYPLLTVKTYGLDLSKE
ncbi:MAG: sulfotransferase family protein, partial [Rhodobacteraceae bacterium]|nr:sulfotransferase family protein [Paracoccaceae bacterium]